MKSETINDQIILVTKALHVAAKWHVDQKRKGVNAEPYVNHLAEVAELVAEATGGKDANLVVAAALHDAIEDQVKTHAEIAELFNSDVAKLVSEVTDDKSLPKAERKRLQIENAPHKSQRAKTIKLADKTSNLRALVNSPPADWPLERRQQYLVWARAVVAGLRGANDWLEAEFDEAAADLEKSLKTRPQP